MLPIDYPTYFRYSRVVSRPVPPRNHVVPSHLDYVPDRFPDPVIAPFPYRQQILCFHPIPSNKRLPTFLSNSHPAVNEREMFNIPSLGKIQNTSSCGGQNGANSHRTRHRAYPEQTSWRTDVTVILLLRVPVFRLFSQALFTCTRLRLFGCACMG